MRNILFTQVSATSTDYFVKIEHSQVDKESYEKVINANMNGNPRLQLDNIDERSHKILQCYKYFYEALKEKGENERESLFNKMFSSNNKMLVVIDLVEGKDDEQAIFDTLNTAGVRLTTAEIIKNALYQKVIKVTKDKEKSYAIDLYKKTWEKTFLSDEETVKYWETERQTGRLTRDNTEILLHSIAVINGFFDPDKHVLSDLSKLYKVEIERRNSEAELKEFIDEIIEYANIYRDKFPSFDKSTLFSFGDPVIKLFHILEVLELSTFHPFILYVFKNYRDDDPRIFEMFMNLEKFVVRRAIAQQEVKNYNKYCKEFINSPDIITEKLKETAEQDISSGLRHISNKKASLLLFWIELHRRIEDRGYDIRELKYNYSLEHIMPQKWDEFWKDIPKKYKEDGSIMNEEELKKDRGEKIYWIGNMTLLTSSLNSKLRNYPFEKKINGENRKKGIRSYAELSITNDDIVIPFDKGEIVWDENRIIDRTKKLENEINLIW